LVAAAVALPVLLRAQAPDEPAPLSRDQVHALLLEKGSAGFSLSSRMGWVTNGFSIEVFSATNWIRRIGLGARNERRVLAEDSITDEDRRDIWRVIAHPNLPGKVNQVDMGSSIVHVVMTNKAGTVTIQPTKETKFPENLQTVGGTTVPYDGITAEFRTADVMALWGKNHDQNFIIGVVGTGGQSGHDFEIKPKYFALLK
jgi:hypothetical protein